MGQILIVDSVC